MGVHRNVAGHGEGDELYCMIVLATLLGYPLVVSLVSTESRRTETRGVESRGARHGWADALVASVPMGSLGAISLSYYLLHAAVYEAVNLMCVHTRTAHARASARARVRGRARTQERAHPRMRGSSTQEGAPPHKCPLDARAHRYGPPCNEDGCEPLARTVGRVLIAYPAAFAIGWLATYYVERPLTRLMFVVLAPRDELPTPMRKWVAPEPGSADAAAASEDPAVSKQSGLGAAMSAAPSSASRAML